MTRPNVVLIGAGGHGRVVLDAINAGASATPGAALDAAKERWGTEVGGVPILGGDDELEGLVSQGISHFIVAVGAVGDNRNRAAIFARAVAAGLEPFTVIHPSAVVAGTARIGRGTFVGTLGVVNDLATIGENVIINTGAIVEHDCVIGSHVHVASGACLAGASEVGDLAHVGAGASVRDGMKIGKRAVVGSGASVVHDVPDEMTVVGVPARPLEANR